MSLLGLLLGYLLGSVDFAVLVSRARGVDIYGVGSGNPGAANVMRSLGPKAAALVLAGDALKGVTAAWVGLALGGTPAAGYAAGLAAVVGHAFPVWHRFRGGKGVATAAGVLLRMDPLVTAGLVLVYLVAVRLGRISSVGSLAAAVVAPVGVALAGRRGWSVALVIAMTALIVVRHRGNIGRLMRGEERKVREG